MKTNRRNAVAALIAAGLLWGTTVPLSKLALYWLSPGWLTAVRFGLAAAVLLAAARRRGPGRGTARRGAQLTPLRAAFTPGVLVAGALGYGGSVMVQNAGITRTSVTHAALLIGAVPVLVAIIAAAWHRTVARPVAWVGFVVSLGGIALVTAGGGGGGATLAGDGLVLASLFLSATVTVAQGRLLIGRDPVAVTAVQFLGATLGALPVAVLTEGVPAVPGSAGPVLAVVGLAGFGTLLPFTLFAFGQSRVSAEVAGAFLNLEPLVGAIAGAVAFGDPVGLAQIAGGVAIVAGIGLSSLPLLAGRQVARRAAATEAARAGARGSVAVPASAGTGRVAAGAGTGHAAVGPGTGRAARVEERTYGCDNVHERVCRLSHPYPSGPRRSRRNGVFAVVRGGKFGTGHSGEVRPGVAGPGQASGRGQGTGPQRALPGGRAAGRPPARGQERSGPGREPGPAGRGRGWRGRGWRGREWRGREWRGRGRRPTAGAGRGGSGRRATGGRGRSWPGASRGR